MESPSAPEELTDDDFTAEWGHPPHVHDFHQFLYVPLGEIRVSALGMELRVSGSAALWIPAGVQHSARFGSGSLILSTPFDAERHRLHRDEPIRVNLTEEQRLLLLRRRRDSREYPQDDELFGALTSAHHACLELPRPTSPAAEAVARALFGDPGDQRTAAEWAQGLYTSSTSLRRAFRAETGLSFSEWRTRLRLNRSLELLDQGLMVGAVAGKVGFTSTNGYILAFRKYFGQTPGSYARRTHPLVELRSG